MPLSGLASFPAKDLLAWGMFLRRWGNQYSVVDRPDRL